MFSKVSIDPVILELACLNAARNWEWWKDDYLWHGELSGMPLFQNYPRFRGFGADYSVFRGLNAEKCENIRNWFKVQESPNEFGRIFNSFSQEHSQSTNRISLVSKLLAKWKPLEYSMWDSLARTGLKKLHGSKRGHCYSDTNAKNYSTFNDDFFELLTAVEATMKGFIRSKDNIPKDLRQSPEFLPRVLDNYLMLLGAPPFLILQLRPEPEASESEYAAILQKAGLTPAQTQRIRLDAEPLPAGLNLQSYAGIIVGGGPGCVSDAPEAKTQTEAKIEAAVLSLMPEIVEQDIPFLGCCYGIGILGHHLARAVNKSNYAEPVGTSQCSLTEAGRADVLTKDLPAQFDAFVGHKEALQTLPEGCEHLISSPTCPYQMIRYKENIYATQFHPEADAAEFETRINIYKHKGYFPPEEADSLIDMVHASNVHAPAQVLRNFVRRYQGE